MKKSEDTGVIVGNTEGNKGVPEFIAKENLLSNVSSSTNPTANREEVLVDNSMLILEVIEGKYYVFVMRPRRFGKSLNMSFPENFYDIGSDDVNFFNKFKIKKERPGLCNEHQNKYLIISINCAEVCDEDIDITVCKIGTLMSNVYKKILVDIEKLQSEDFFKRKSCKIETLIGKYQKGKKSK